MTMVYICQLKNRCTHLPFRGHMGKFNETQLPPTYTSYNKLLDTKMMQHMIMHNEYGATYTLNIWASTRI